MTAVFVVVGIYVVLTIAGLIFQFRAPRRKP